MSEGEGIGELRARFLAAQSFHERIVAFTGLASHPDLEWGDVLGFLEHPGFIREQAAICLRVKLDRENPDPRLVYDREHWINLLSARGYELCDICGPCWKTTMYSAKKEREK